MMTSWRVFFTAAILCLFGIAAGCATSGEGRAQNDDDRTAVAVAASDQGAETVEETVAEDAAENDSGMICQRIKLTGSRFPRRVCMTAAQREAMAEEASDFLRTGGANGSMQTVNNALADPSQE